MLHYHTQTSPGPATQSAFHKGDSVCLARGSYQGTLGVFLNLCSDPKWAEILEPDSKLRSHPVEWLEHVASVNKE